MQLLGVSSKLFAVVVGTMFCCSVVTGDVTVESGQTQAHILSVQSVHVTTGSFVDTEACYVAMEEAMKNTDHRNMNLEEYLKFAIAYRPDDSFAVDDDTVGDHPHGDISSTAVEELFSSFYRLDGSNAGIDTTGSFVGETPTVSEQSYLFQVCTQTSIIVHNQSHDSIHITPPSTTTTTVPVPIAVNGTTILVPPTIMNSDEQGQINNDNSTTTTTAITEEEDRRVASIAGPIVVVVVIALMIIACYVTRGQNKSDDDDDYDAAVAVLLLQEEGSSVDHHDSDDHDDDHVVIVDTAIKMTNVSNDCVMTNQMFLKVEQDGGDGGGGENDSLSSSSSSVISSAGWSSSAGLDSMNTTPTTNDN